MVRSYKIIYTDLVTIQYNICNVWHCICPFSYITYVALTVTTIKILRHLITLHLHVGYSLLVWNICHVRLIMLSLIWNIPNSQSFFRCDIDSSVAWFAIVDIWDADVCVPFKSCMLQEYIKDRKNCQIIYWHNSNWQYAWQTCDCRPMLFQCRLNWVLIQGILNNTSNIDHSHRQKAIIFPYFWKSADWL